MKKKSKMSWEEFWRGCGVVPPPPHPLSLKKKSKRRGKRFRPEKVISEREFLTGERRTKHDLPKELEIVPDSKKRHKAEPEASTANNKTRKYLGSGKKPKWMDCPEKEVSQDA